MQQLFRAAFSLAFAALSGTTAGAQLAQPPATLGTHHQVVVTGCIKRGNQPDTFVISDQNGTTWELVSGASGVDLSKQIFHSVSITGNEAPSHQKKSAETVQHKLLVLSLQVLSRSCTR